MLSNGTGRKASVDIMMLKVPAPNSLCPKKKSLQIYKGVCAASKYVDKNSCIMFTLHMFLLIL